MTCLASLLTRRPLVQISSRLLVSHALAAISPSAHTLSHLPALLHSLHAELHPLPSRVHAYTSGLSLFPPQGPSSYMDTPSLLHLDNCLRLLDSYLIGSWTIPPEDTSSQPASMDQFRDQGNVKALVALCVSCTIIQLDKDLEEYRPVGMWRSRSLPAVNLSNNCSSWEMYRDRAPRPHQSHS